MSVRRWLSYNRGIALITLGLVNVAVFTFAHVNSADTPKPSVTESDGLKLVGERSIELIRPDLSPRRETAQVAAAAAPALACRQWGPIFEASALDAILVALSERDIAPILSDMEVQVDRRFTVQLGPFQDLDRLRSVERRLDDGGVDRMRFGGAPDYYISTGVFSSQTRAMKQRDRLLNLGLNSTMKISGKPAAAKRIKAYLPLETRLPDHPGTPCPEIAQGR